MPVLRRILKYTPAVVLGLLVVAWVVSRFGMFGWSLRPTYNQDVIRFYGVAEGSLHVSHHNYGKFQQDTGWYWLGGCGRSVIAPFPGSETTYVRIPGPYHPEGRGAVGVIVRIPIPLLLTAILPLAIGPFVSFRFRLWHYLAYTALVAVELAYYLRWQE
jgi:hypothetical protein